MSLLIDGNCTFNIARSQGPTTLVSSFFVQTYIPRRRANSLAPFALTLNTVDRGPLTVVLSCQISSSLEYDIVLALDWKSQLRDLLLYSGYSVPAAFDPWSMISGFVFLLTFRNQLEHIHPPTMNIVMRLFLINLLFPVPVVRYASAGGADASAGGADASAGGADASAGGADASAGGADDSAGGADILRIVDAATPCNPNYDPILFKSSSSTSPLYDNTGELLSDESIGHDRVEGMLSSTKSACNIFALRNQDYYFKMMQGHGIPSQNLSSLQDCKQAILTHLLAGGCSMSHHPHPSLTECNLINQGFDDSRDLSYFALSIIISSRDLSNAIPTLASMFGINSSNTDFATRETMIRARLLSMRSSLVEQFSEQHPSKQVLEGINLTTVPLASLISIAALHGIPTRDCSRESLRNVITTHLLSGACGSQRFGSFSIGCQSIVNQSFPKVPSGSFTQEEFEQALQDGPAKLRSLVGKFLKSLDSKQPSHRSRQAKRDKETEKHNRELRKTEERLATVDITEVEGEIQKNLPGNDLQGCIINIYLW
ncbi:hypothetical protein R3P38DRAFT_3376828, partial [Favolaschia claudopus]